MYQENELNEKIYVGEINERGLINSFDRLGMTANKGLLELIGNSCDANARNISFVIYNKNNNRFIRLIDDGCGMNIDKLSNAFKICNENNTDEIKIGVSGVGLKVSTKCCSNNTDVYFYTKSINNILYKAKIPWTKIVKQGRWTGNVNIKMCTNRIDNALYNNMVNNKTGTCIEFEYSDDLRNIILSQFNDKKYELKKEERIDYIFGSTNLNIICKDYDNYNENIYDLQLYNPFKLDENNYIYKDNIIIDCFINKQFNYIQFAKKINNNDYECFESTGKNIKKKIKLKNFNKATFKFVGTLKLNICCLKFINNNLEIEELFELSNSNNYIKNFYGNMDFSNNNDFIVLKRNNAIINDILLNKKKSLDKRTKFLSKNILMELEYITNSSQTNLFDNIIGIQGNKHQYLPDEKKLETLFRLCRKIKEDIIEEVYKILLNNIINHEPICENDVNEPICENDVNEQNCENYVNEQKCENYVNEEYEIDVKELLKKLKDEFKKKNITKANYYNYINIYNDLLRNIFDK